MIAYKKLTQELIEEYFDEICSFYYANVITCSCEFTYSMEAASQKIAGMKDFVAIDKAICYGAFDGEKIVGYFWAYVHQFRQEMRLYLNEIHILAEYRSQGIGHQFIEIFQKEARMLGVPAVYLHAEGSNKRGIEFYLREEFEIERIQFRKEIRSENG